METAKVAIPVFRSRVAPVLNWCSKMHIFPDETGKTGCTQEELVLLGMNAFDRLRVLREDGVRTLICGALSPDLLSYGESLGLRVIHGIAGDVWEVFCAYCSRELDDPRFWIPGCRRGSGGCCRKRGPKTAVEGVGTIPPAPHPKGGM